MSASPTQAPGLTRNPAIGLLAPLLGAMLLGVVVLFGVGFSNISIAHNAAHDVRHANNFPCH
jgi:cobalt transporter subunit CbtB